MRTVCLSLAARLARLGGKDWRFKLALLVSLLLHGLMLLLKLAEPPQPPPNTPPPAAAERIEATLLLPRKPATPTKKPSQPAVQPQVLAARPHADSRVRVRPPTPPEQAERKWSRAERNEMDQFLNDLAQESRPVRGADLAERALLIARTLRLPPTPDDDMAGKIMQKLAEAKVEPLSIELYLNALFGKMNRSAAMLNTRDRPKGVKPAAVRILLNRDGSVRRFDILRTADQQGEIDFIRSVVDMAAPFPVFPPDIARATDTLVMQICIRPDRIGSGSGGAFSRMSPGESCL